MNGSGFGICGHRNSYNSGVRNGNWVEDLIGQDLHEMGGDRGRVTEANYRTEGGDSFIHPGDMPNKASAGAPPMQDTSMADSRVGLSYDMMFKHGKGMAGHDEAGYTPPHAAIGPVPLKIGSSVSNSKMMERTKALARAGREVATRESESHSASRGMPTPTFQVKATTRDGEAPMPVTRFHKSSKFSLGGDFH